MKLSIIIPCYNEEKTISFIVAEIKKRQLPNIEKEIIVVDDGSNDSSLSVIKKFDGIKIVSNEKNFGKGYSIKKALDFCEGDTILIQDADLEYNPVDYDDLLYPLLDNNYQVVYGSRMLKKNLYSYREYCYGGKLLTIITNLLYGTKLTDMTTGFKVFKKSVLANIRLIENGFEFEAEITAKIAKQNTAILEVPISYRPRKKEEGKKIKMLDGIKMFIVLLKYRFIN